jgi:hypothetical protein
LVATVVHGGVYRASSAPNGYGIWSRWVDEREQMSERVRSK